MPRRSSVALVLSAVCGAGSYWVTASGPDDKHTVPAGASVVADGMPPQRQYVGIKKCRMCHVDQFPSFEASAKANSWEALKSGVGVEVKKKAGLDPAADYTRDVRCLTCHSTGFGEPGGYAIPDPKDKVAVATAASREGVGCESCHGPGSGFIERMQDIHRNERTYRREELLSAGLRPTAADTCDKCHNTDALCQKGRADRKVDPADRRGYHDKFPFKFRIDESAGSKPTGSP